MKKFLFIFTLMLAGVSALAQPDKRDVRQGNRAFDRQRWSAADISYRKALMADSTSVAANYNLASVQYRQEDYQGAAKSLQRIAQTAPATPHAADYFYNVGDAALQAKDYKTAVEAFMQSLLRNPGDLDAKENFIYARKMLENQQQGGDGQDDRNQDQQNQDQQNQQNQDQDQNKDQQDKQEQDQDQNQDHQDQQDQQEQPARGELSPQQAQQILQAMQDQEKATQDKVKKEKAEVLKSRQKEKNW